MYHVSCFIPSSKQATPDGHISKHHMGISQEILSMDTLHNIIKYLLPSSSKSLENSILVYYIYSIYRNWPWTYQSGQMSITIWGRPISTDILTIPTYVITHTCLLHLSPTPIPQFTTGSQILDKGAIINKDQNDREEDILEMEERTKGGKEPE